MRRVFSILSLLLAVTWLPATQHCLLEATGLMVETCADNCQQDADVKDGCGTLESGSYKPSVYSLRASAPTLLALAVGYLSLDLIQSEATSVPVIAPGESFERPRDWASTWHFVRRSAPSPRAPSVSLA
jgi:hypothetical protein